MKKNYTFYLSLLCIPVFGVLFLSFGSGQASYYVSGSPSDNADTNNDIGAGIVGNCTLCHTGNPVIADSPIITLTVPSDYELNTTYNIMVATSSAATRQGFQMSVEDSSGNKVGDFIDDGLIDNQDFDLGRGEAITHTGSGAFNAPWSFQWTSPATDVGPVTFYAALNESNQDFNLTGDQIHLKQSSANLLSVESVVFEDLKVYPNPSQDFVTIDLPSQLISKSNVIVYDFLGKQVLTQNLSATRNTLNVSNWQSGVYLMKFISEDVSLVKRFVKL